MPCVSVVLAFDPMMPFATRAAAGNLSWVAVKATLPWACAILPFLSGVRRRVSFRTESGARPAQIAAMTVPFVLCFSAATGVVEGRL